MITRMKCNGLENPLGYAIKTPRLSWIVDAPDAKELILNQVLISTNQDMNNILYDSGERTDIDSTGFMPEIQLRPCTRYFWKVRTMTDLGEITSPAAWFETGKMEEPWQAGWISPDSQSGDVHPLLCKRFVMNDHIKAARLYICGLGLYELSLNGLRVGDEYLTPYCNAYDEWLQYQTFDVTDQLLPGENVLGVMLGNGWYKGRFGFEGIQGGCYGDSFALLCELVITCDDDTTVKIVSDETWQSVTGPVLSSGIYDGEIQDANKERSGWATREYDHSNWPSVIQSDLGYDRLQERRSLPVRIIERRNPVKIIHTPKGEKVLDFGQNMVGWVSFINRAPAGAELVMMYGEEMQDGCFSRENLRSAKAEFRYISSGEKVEVQPHFTFYGFRYVNLINWPGEINPEDFTGCVVHSDMMRTGKITTSNPMINRLFENALWSQRGNFVDVPTDCPQRDERMGWTGDAQVFSGTACFNMDSNAFFSKFLYDLSLEQKANGGIVPHVVPVFQMGKGKGNSFMSGGSSVWGDAATIIPWNIYLHYGDKSILSQQYESMKTWVEYIRSLEDGKHLWTSGFHFGDWLEPNDSDPTDVFGTTPTEVIASVFYYHSTLLLAKSARILGKDNDAAEFFALADKIKQAVQDEFLTPAGRMAVNTQTAHALLLIFDLIPLGQRSLVAESLAKLIASNKFHLKTGFSGTPYLNRVLSENGFNDLAYALLLNEDYPSWLYEVKLGATTIWERWNSLLPDGHFSGLGMNSLNHYAYGSIVEWMYRNMCGINPVEEHPGFRKFVLRPQPCGLLQWAEASLESTSGLIKSRWEIDHNGLHFKFSVPFHTTAELILPDCSMDDLLINSKSVHQLDIDAHQAGQNVICQLRSGSYLIDYRPTRNYIMRYTTENTLSELVLNQKVRDMLMKILPSNVFSECFIRNRKMFGSMPLKELIRFDSLWISESMMTEIEKELELFNEII